MNNEDFEKHVTEHSLFDLDLNYAIIGICGEAGECAEWHKKYNLRQNRTGLHSPEDLKKELGDVLFYLTRAAMLSGWSLSDVMEHNKQKLDDRVSKKMRQIV